MPLETIYFVQVIEEGVPRADKLKMCADDLAREITMMNEWTYLLFRT